MLDFIAFISLLAVLVFLVLAVISLIKKKGKAKRNFLFAVTAFVLFMVCIINAPSSTSETANTTPEEEVSAQESNNDDNAKEEAAKKKAEEEVKKTPQQEMISKIQELISSNHAYDSGSYIKGDIAEGEYAFIPFDGSGQYYAEKDGAGNIIDNENFDSFGYVYVHGAGNIDTGGVLISPASFETLGVKSAKEIYQVVNQVEGEYKESAWYKVGVDIPAGQYVIESYGEGYVAVMSGPVGNNDIVDNEIFNGRYQLSVSDGQYLKISQGVISE
ncbi:hypothetical protein [Bacillus sp. es.034]|uniref:hypothetical protein n=1 Tax=Bacillus sp. es.034 TaxID=1761763 RepID=UPI000BF9CA2F|nr:hypothetical protein [Bacillus sp. es.034]PFG03345.1 hypothetical protein ATG71_0008 [Bacillus sp. es.034]PFG07802.1 hypothetical protein ATG71_4711 [Bacillus sp. es.034]